MEKELVKVFPVSMRMRMQNLDWEGLEEIRVRIGMPMELIYQNRSEWLGSYESRLDRSHLDEMLNYMTHYSIYAMEEELRQGYITYEGGHRIGITGHATYETAEGRNPPHIRNMVEIGGFNIRIAHEKKGCAKEIVPHIRVQNSIYNTILFAAPGIGKTTYIRDMIRILATGDETNEAKKICVVDERSEIAACIDGKAQHDLGKRCDVLDACPKATGMKMLLRTMSPEIIAVDEIGRKEEFYMLEQMRCSGVKILGTMHAGSMTELFENPMLKTAVRTRAIERFVELKRQKDGKRTFCIYDGQGKMIWEQ